MRWPSLVAAAALLPAGALAQADDPIVVLERTNPDIAAARAEAEAARADLRAARGARLPQLRVEAQAGTVEETLRLGGLAGTFEGTRDPASVAAVAEQALFTSGRLAGEVDAAKGRLGAAGARADLVRQDVLRAGAVATAEVARARAALAERTQNEAALTARLDETAARRGAGLATVTDLSQSEARLAAARADRVVAAGDVLIAEASYARLFGAPPGEEAAMPSLPDGLPSTLDDAVKAALEGSPSLIVSTERVAAARGAARAARGALLPQVSLSAQAAYAEDERFGDLLGEAEQLGVFVRGRWDVFSGGSGHARASAARRRARGAVAEAEAERRAVRDRTVEAWTRGETARAVRTARLAQVAAAEQARDGVAAEQAAGRRTRLDLLDAERELTEARVALLAAERDLVAATYGLATVLGRL